MQEHKRILYSNGKIRVPYRKAYLMDNHGNVHSYWRIICYIWDGNKQALVRQQKYGGINKHRTLSKRYEVANELIDEINELATDQLELSLTDSENTANFILFLGPGSDYAELYPSWYNAFLPWPYIYNQHILSMT